MRNAGIPGTGSDRRVSGSQPGDRVRRPESGGDLRLGACDLAPGGVLSPGQEGAGRDPDVYAEGNRAEPGADHASDRAVPKDGRAKVASWPAASVCPQVHRGGHPAAGRGGPGPRAAQRAGDAARAGARIQGVRQAGVRTAGGDFGLAPVQPESDGRVSEAGGGVRAHASHGHPDRRATQTRSAGEPGHLRVDSVHQGDSDGVKGSSISTQWTR